MSTYGVWLSAAGMKINEHKQSVLANNMANINTVGFKHDLAVIRERRLESQSSAGGFDAAHDVLDGLAGGVNVRPSHHNFGQGPIETTGRPMDVAIRGDGFFSVSDGSETRYTRNGAFTINGAGELTLASGDGRWRVLDENGLPIRLDPEGERISVSASGTIRQGATELATLGFHDTNDRGSLRKVGETLFEDQSGTMRPTRSEIAPESREQSNFDVVGGLTSMIEITRAYELNANLLRLQDQALSEAVNTVGRLA